MEDDDKIPSHSFSENSIILSEHKHSQDDSTDPDIETEKELQQILETVTSNIEQEQTLLDEENALASELEKRFEPLLALVKTLN